MNYLILYFIFLLFASFFLLKITNKILRFFNFISIPTGRGLHKLPVTTSGGVYFIFYLIVLNLNLNLNGTLFENNIAVIFILLLTTIIFGLLDDKRNFSRRYKLFVQIILSITMIIFFNFELFQNLFPSVEIDILYLILNILFLISFINFINFIDGSDGNLILFVFFIFFCLVAKLYFSFSIDQYIYLIYFFPFLISFYFFNIKKKIFLGDSGSSFLSIFLILNLNYFVNKEIILIYDVIIISSYFITDMILTFFLRIYYYGFNSFKAHRDHAYQNYCYLKKDHKKLNLYMCIYNFIYLFPLYFLFLHEFINYLSALLFCLVPPVIFVIKYSPLINYKNKNE
jgi:UDP-N-acetylmuramyl pentapeptide phosphotransferase/UDP-N-acetylglucosamine-1-phosphate transferase